MKSILLIIPYFGKWPIWFDAYLVSIAANPSINWLCPTDCEIPINKPSNIEFLPISLQDLNVRVNNIVSAKVPLTARKFCDLKPAYGAIFKEEIKGFDFWGFCDMDIIWGDIRKFMTNDILSDFDIISSRKKEISGHFTLFKNIEVLNKHYKTVQNYKALFELNHVNFDEYILTAHLKKNNSIFKIYWPKILCNQERGIDSHQEYYLDRWQWNHGKMLDVTLGKEVMYLHFINWKGTMKYSEVIYTDNPASFYISYNGIHYVKNLKTKHLFNSFKNVFNGFWIKERRRVRIKNINKLSKRIYNKIIKILTWK